MIKGFKDFILRGNVVDLAVAVVIGAAFGAIVTTFTNSIIQPLVNAITPASSPGLGISVVAGKQSTYIDFAAVITAALNFLIVAAIVYFIIVYPLNALKQRRRKGEEPGPSEPTDVQLLIEIRDLLRAQTYSSSDGKHSDRA
jgi:large conductance mechanosensitive channel